MTSKVQRNLFQIFTTFALQIPALQRKAEIDAKTGLFNARYFSQALEKELARPERFDRPLTVVMADLDDLRHINNTYGHIAGDAVINGIAHLAQKSLRDYDIVARFGGEEFAILMPETTPEQAQPRIEALRAAIEAAKFEAPAAHTAIKATLSFGIAGREKTAQKADEILHNADLAAYQAKQQGRNRIHIYSVSSQD